MEEAKLKTEIIEENSKTVKDGYIISQETEADTEKRCRIKDAE